MPRQKVGPIALVYGGNARQRDEGAHRIEVMTGMDDVRPDGKRLKAGGHGHQIEIEQPSLLSRIAAIGDDEVAEPLEPARQVANEQVGAGALVEAIVGDQNMHPMIPGAVGHRRHLDPAKGLAAAAATSPNGATISSAVACASRERRCLVALTQCGDQRHDRLG